MVFFEGTKIDDSHTFAELRKAIQMVNRILKIDKLKNYYAKGITRKDLAQMLYKKLVQLEDGSLPKDVKDIVNTLKEPRGKRAYKINKDNSVKVFNLEKKGRPPKYTTEEEQKKKKREQTLASNKKKRAEKKEKELQKKYEEHSKNASKEHIDLMKKLQEEEKLSFAQAHKKAMKMEKEKKKESKKIKIKVKKKEPEKEEEKDPEKEEKKTKKIIVKKPKKGKGMSGAGRLMYPNNVQSVIDSVGDEKVRDINIKRQPVSGLISGALNVFSLGKFGKRKMKEFDELFHLYIELITDKNNFVILEKNERINAELSKGARRFEKIKITPKTIFTDEMIKTTRDKPTSNVRPNEEVKKVLNVPNDLTIRDILENTRDLMGDDKFFIYDAVSNNCQDFIIALLNANNIGDEQDRLFVKQDTEHLFKKLGITKSVAKTTTDLGATIMDAKDDVEDMFKKRFVPKMKFGSMLGRGSHLIRPEPIRQAMAEQEILGRQEFTHSENSPFQPYVPPVPNTPLNAQLQAPPQAPPPPLVGTPPTFQVSYSESSEANPPPLNAQRQAPPLARRRNFQVGSLNTRNVRQRNEASVADELEDIEDDVNLTFGGFYDDRMSGDGIFGKLGKIFRRNRQVSPNQEEENPPPPLNAQIAPPPPPPEARIAGQEAERFVPFSDMNWGTSDAFIGEPLEPVDVIPSSFSERMYNLRRRDPVVRRVEDLPYREDMFGRVDGYRISTKRPAPANQQREIPPTDIDREDLERRSVDGINDILDRLVPFNREPEVIQFRQRINQVFNLADEDARDNELANIFREYPVLVENMEQRRREARRRQRGRRRDRRPDLEF